MQLNKHLVLFRYILGQFGYDQFEKLRDDFSDKRTGYDATGRSFIVGSLLGTPKTIDDRTLLHYDEVIKEYEARLKAHRAEPFLTFKYYQYFALLFTEYYFDHLSANASAFLKGLNDFKRSDQDFETLEDYSETDLKKLAYWMATGSGKTLIMHCNYWQVTKYFKEWENIILITPNEGLSRQHYESFLESGIAAKIYSGSEESLKTKAGEVLIIEITKLVREKEGEGVSVDVDYFAESRNLVFIDEGHKGQKSEERAWKRLREYITRGNDSFTFEYSATFGQIITKAASDLLNEYGKSIIFDYSYRHFYSDGYGKDFTVFNIDVKNNYSEDQTRLLLTASLMGFYEQLELFDQYREELRAYNIEKPLWVFVGSKVIGNSSSGLSKTDRQNVSDVTLVVRFIQDILANPASLQADIDRILDKKSNLMNAAGDDIFENRFLYLRENRPDAAAILQKVFHGVGQIEALQIKQAEGEIGLRTRTGEHYFAVINIGDVSKYAKKLEEDTEGGLVIQEDNISQSLFRDIPAAASTVNLLIGSKKFIEGWNSWRVSSMGLMNMGKGEGAQIIQLFGRGVRLKGKELSLKREEASAAYQLRALQTISIFGLNASYMNNFLSHIEKETPDYREYSIDIRFNRRKNWEGKILTLKPEADRDFKDITVILEAREEILRRVSIDLRTRISVAAGGFNNQVAEPQEEYRSNFLKKFYGFIDFPALMLEANRFKLQRNYHNLMINRQVLEEIISQDSYDLLSHEGQFGWEEAVNGRIQDIAGYLIKDYMEKYYSDREKEYLSRHLTAERLTVAAHPDMFPPECKLIVKTPKDHFPAIKKLLTDVEKFYSQDVQEIPTLHIDEHLYSPIASWRPGKKFQEIKTIPAKLNEGESRFLKHLRQYLKSIVDRLNGREVYVLRNLSQRGVGFFMESSAFYPDFVLWVIEEKKQHLLFLDPKGIRETRNFNHSKIIFCSRQAPEISTALQKKITDKGLDLEMHLRAFILSTTSFDAIKGIWGNEGASRQEFKDHHILFIDDEMNYLNELFENVLP